MHEIDACTTPDRATNGPPGAGLCHAIRGFVPFPFAREFATLVFNGATYKHDTNKGSVGIDAAGPARVNRIAQMSPR
jgi:hypothetical protein